jgi:hypothetical protein
VPSYNGSAIFIPESIAISELEPGKSRFTTITRQWLAWVREVSRLLQRINATGTQNGVVVTDDTGTATVVDLAMENVPYDAATFTASSGTWTVAEADVTTWARVQLGKQLFLRFHFTATSVSATPAELRVTLPAGTSLVAESAVCYLSDNGTAAAGIASTTAAGSTLVFTRLDGANFSIAADATVVKGQMRVELT